MTQLAPDIVRFITRSFPAREHAQVMQLLTDATIHDGSRAEDRLLRCAVVAAEASLERLQYYVGLLQLDYRDVIVAGEYEYRNDDFTLIRDLSVPLP
jgi:hypothetical protein